MYIVQCSRAPFIQYNCYCFQIRQTTCKLNWKWLQLHICAFYMVYITAPMFFTFTFGVKWEPEELNLFFVALFALQPFIDFLIYGLRNRYYRRVYNYYLLKVLEQTYHKRWQLRRKSVAIFKFSRDFWQLDHPNKSARKFKNSEKLPLCCHLLIYICCRVTRFMTESFS